MFLHVFFMCLVAMDIFTAAAAIPCDSCGNECASACGTKNFRTCCFNYLRKRTDPNALKLFTNKRLIDFIMLQGRALYTQNELSREEEAAEAEALAQARSEAAIVSDDQAMEPQAYKFYKRPLKSPYLEEQRRRHNGTLYDLQQLYG